MCSEQALTCKTTSSACFKYLDNQSKTLCMYSWKKKGVILCAKGDDTSHQMLSQMAEWVHGTKSANSKHTRCFIYIYCATAQIEGIIKVYCARFQLTS